MKLIKESDFAVVYDDGDKIIKTSKIYVEHLDIGWWGKYDQFHKEYGISPKIYDFIPHKTLVMEKIEGITMENFLIESYSKSLSKDREKTYLDCLKIIQEIKYYMADFATKISSSCTHTDLSVVNIFMTSNKQYNLIDIDSFRFDWPLHMTCTLDVEGWLMNQLISNKLRERFS